MFDPTAFENMKVIFEGELYDRDLAGEISIIDRNDLMNVAKLKRIFEITFINQPSIRANQVKCTVTLEANLENLAAELLPAVQSEKLSGCYIYIMFSLDHPNKMDIHKAISDVMTEIWGSERTYKQVASFDPLKNSDSMHKEISIEFNRIVYEDQISDLIQMIEYMLLTLDKLERI